MSSLLHVSPKLNWELCEESMQHNIGSDFLWKYSDPSAELFTMPAHTQICYLTNEIDHFLQSVAYTPPMISRMMPHM